MDLSKIVVGDNYEIVNAFVEIPKGSNIKYEYDPNIGAIVVSRALHSAMYYPANYGFVPNTKAPDGEPVDIIILNEQPLLTRSIISCRLIGVLDMEDEGGVDEKLIAVPLSHIDPTFDDITSINDFPQATRDKIKNFFETYKMLEPNKWVKVKGFKDKNSAMKLLQNSIIL